MYLDDSEIMIDTNFAFLFSIAIHPTTDNQAYMYSVYSHLFRNV